jgi:hypothetical protein
LSFSQCACTTHLLLPRTTIPRRRRIVSGLSGRVDISGGRDIFRIPVVPSPTMILILKIQKSIRKFKNYLKERAFWSLSSHSCSLKHWSQSSLSFVWSELLSRARTRYWRTISRTWNIRDLWSDETEPDKRVTVYRWDFFFGWSFMYFCLHDGLSCSARCPEPEKSRIWRMESQRTSRLKSRRLSLFGEVRGYDEDRRNMDIWIAHIAMR